MRLSTIWMQISVLFLKYLRFKCWLLLTNRADQGYSADMKVSCKVRAAAKINIGLQVGRPNVDGYHAIAGIMQAVSLFDFLQFSMEDETSGIAVYGGFDCPVVETTIYRAADRFYEAIGTEPHVRIDVEKNIPAKAGLGGGSSDAGATLLCLNYLYENILNDDQLLTLAKSVGADVPFFVRGASRSDCSCGACVVGGIGDVLEPIASRTDLGILLVYPGFGVSTAWAYKKLDMYRASGKVGSGNISNGASAIVDSTNPVALANPIVDTYQSNIRNWKYDPSFENSFQAMLEEEFPIYGILEGGLRKVGAEFVSISGSGSCLYGIFPSIAGAEHAKAELLASLKSDLNENTIQSISLFAKRPLERSIYLE